VLYNSVIKPRYWISRLISICFIYSIVCMVILSACATSFALTQEELASIESVTISQEVPMPDSVEYLGSREKVWGLCCFLVGDVIAEPGRKRTATRIQDAMNRSHIDVREIVLTEFEKQLRESRLFKEVIVGGDGYPRFKLKIIHHGLTVVRLADQLLPYIRMEGVLVKSDQTTIWRKKVGLVFTLGEDKRIPTQTLEEYLKDPELIRKGFSVVAAIEVSEMINDMKEEQLSK
jgi:hypothetical protein